MTCIDECDCPHCGWEVLEEGVAVKDGDEFTCPHCFTRLMVSDWDIDGVSLVRVDEEDDDAPE